MRSYPGSLVRSLPIFILLAAVSCSGSGSSHKAPPDNTPPTFSGASQATAIGETAIVVPWSPASDNRDAPPLIVYNVYQATSPGAEDFQAPTATTLGGATFHIAAGLLPNTTYYFVVRAMDRAGNEDSNFFEVSATTLASPDAQAPTFAGASSATATSESSIDISWFAATDDNTPQWLITYNLYSATTSGLQNFSTPDLTSLPGETALTLGGLQPTTTYYIVVRAVDFAGNEDTNINEVSDTTFTPDTTPPNFAGLISATPFNATKIDLGWATATDNRAQPQEIFYNVYWATNPGGQNFASPNASTVPGFLTYRAQALNANTTYYFVVRAEDPAGNEDTNFMERSATTPVSFASQVLQIFTSNCTVSNCHGSSNPVLGLDLSNYSSIFNTAINFQADQPPATLDRIEPGNSVASYLQHKLDGTHLSVGGSGQQQPPGGPLPAADRDLVRAWINQGALDN